MEEKVKFGAIYNFDQNCYKVAKISPLRFFENVMQNHPRNVQNRTYFGDKMFVKVSFTEKVMF